VAREIEELQAVAASTPAARPELARYLEQVRDHARTIGDADVRALTAAGVGEDEIFEQTVAVAIREGLRRLEAAMRAVG
jgi:hypothetical protein